MQAILMTDHLMEIRKNLNLVSFKYDNIIWPGKLKPKPSDTLVFEFTEICSL